MLRACSKCGKFHAVDVVCPKAQPFKARQQVRDSEADKFRNKQIWKRKARQIKERDLNLCQVCFRMIYGGKGRYNSDSLSVHHIVPLKDDITKGLDSYNLITLCPRHHEAAEQGTISASVLLEIASEQENKG